MKKDRKYSATVRIENITLSQSIAIEDMFALWQQLGGLGSSRWTSFYADGDGNFRPKIFYNGRKAQRFNKLWRSHATCKQGSFCAWKESFCKKCGDFDIVSWKLGESPDIERKLQAKQSNNFLRVLWRSTVVKLKEFHRSFINKHTNISWNVRKYF